MTRSTDLAVLSRVAEHRQGRFAGTPNLWMNGEKGAFADWWWMAKLVAGHDLCVPLCRKVLDLLEIQDRGFTLTDDCCPLTFLGQQRHRAQHCRAQFHRAMICQDDELFGVKGHGPTPTLSTGPQSQHTRPNAQLSR